MNCLAYSCSFISDEEFTEEELALFNNVTDSRENATIHVYPNREHSEDDEDHSLAVLCSDVYAEEGADEDDVFNWICEWASDLASDCLGRKVELGLHGELSEGESDDLPDEEANVWA